MIVWPGLRKSGSAIRRLFNSASFDAPLTYTAVPTRAATGTAATFTRATTKTFTDNEGVLRTAPAGCAAFTGARFVRNLLPSTEGAFDAGAGWTVLNGTVTPNVSDPNGGTSAYTLKQTGASSCELYPTTPFSGSVLSSVWIRRRTGTGTIFLYGGDTVTNITASVTSEWQRIPSNPTNSSAVGFDLRLLDANDEIDFWRPQSENITGRADQTTPSEYVSVGVLSAPYHGAGVDGVKYFDTDLDGNPLPTSATYDAVWLNGVAGTYVSTPDSVAASITGDIDIRVKAALNDWTSGAGSCLVAKADGSGGDWAFEFLVLTSGALFLRCSADGSTLTAVTSTASVSFTNGQIGHCRATRSAATGYVNFYTSSDGVTWTLLGDANGVTTAGGIFNSTQPVRIGTENSVSYYLSGQIYRAQIYNGIDGTLAVDFDASRYAGGTTLTGSTGETWTLQGNAVIHPTNSPMLGYNAEGARTNLCLYSNAGTDTVNSGLTSHTYTEPGAPDGTSTFQKILEDAANSTHVSYQPSTLNYAIANSTVTTWSAYVKGGLGRDWCFMSAYDGADNISYFNIAAGTTGSSAAGNFSRIESIGNGIYRISITRTTGAASANLGAISVGAAEADGVFSYAGDITKGIYRWGLQVELGSFATSYIPTTTIAVARNADVLTYTSAGNVSGTVGWCYAEASFANAAYLSGLAANVVGTSTSGRFIEVNSSTSLRCIDSAVNVAAKTLGTPLSSATSKLASTWSVSGGMLVTANGESPATQATFVSMDTAGNIGVMCRNDGTTQPYGNIKNVRIGQRQLSSSELQAITR